MNENEKHEIEQPKQGIEVAGTSSGDTAAESLATLREKKTDEYLRAAVANEDPLMAGAAMLNADLQFYALEVRRMIEPALKSASADAQEMMNLFPMLDMPLRLCRQSMQISTFMERLKRQQESTEKVVAGKAMILPPIAVEQSGDHKAV